MSRCLVTRLNSSVFIQNTISSCDWHTTSGIAIRKPSSAMLNQKVLEEDTKYDAGGVSGGRFMWFWNLTDAKGVVVDGSYRNDECNVDCQCKNTIEKHGLTYYDKNSNQVRIDNIKIYMSNLPKEYYNYNINLLQMKMFHLYNFYY